MKVSILKTPLAQMMSNELQVDSILVYLFSLS